MKKRAFSFLLVCALLAVMLASCTPGEVVDSAVPDARSYEDYIGKGIRIATQTGDVYGDVARDLFGAEVLEYNSVTDMLESMNTGRTDAVLLSHGYVKQLQDSGSYPNVEYLWVPKDVYINEAAPIFGTAELRDAYNEWFEGIASDGTWDEIVSRWLDGSLPAQEDIPTFDFSNASGTLLFADTGNYPPLSYFDEHGEHTGYDVEMTNRFALHLGVKPEYVMMSYEGIVPSVVSGKVDASACQFTVTDERDESMLFGTPNVITQAVLIVPSQGASTQPVTKELDYSDYIGAKLGHKTGSFWDQVLPQYLNAELAFYTEVSAGLEDVRKGRIDGYVTDLSAVRALVAAEGNEDLAYVVIPAEFFEAPMGAVSLNEDLVGRFNEFLAEIDTDGTLGEMQNRWLENIPDLDSPMPDINLTGENGTLKVATTAGALPFSYMGANGELKGYCIELVQRFAEREGLSIEYAEMEFGALIPYVVSGRADLAIADISVTEERKLSVLFTDPIFNDQGGIIVLKRNAITNAAVFHSYTDLAGRKVGGLNGAIWGELTESILNAIPSYYTTSAAGLEDVRSGRLDGYMVDLSEARIITSQSNGQDLAYIEIPSELFTAPMGAISNNQDIIDRFNAFLADITADGLLADMQTRWLDTVPDLDSPMPDIPLTGNKGTLQVSLTGTAIPYSFIGNDGGYKGYCVELAQRFAAHEGMNIVFTAIDFSGALAYVAAGKTDIFIDVVSITEERKQSVLFTDPIYTDQAAVVILKPLDSAFELGTRSYTELKGQKIAAITGAVTDTVIEAIGGTPVYYSDETSAYEDIRKGRVYGLMVDLSSTRVVASTPGNEDLDYIAVPAEYFTGPMGAISTNTELLEKFNKYLAEAKADGTLADMQRRWLETVPDLDSPMPNIQTTGENGVLKVATCGTALPFVYVGADGELKGYSAELALRFAASEGMTVEFINMEFSAQIPYVVSGKADLGISVITITDERREQVPFSDSVYDDTFGVVVLRKTEVQADGKVGIIEWLKTAVERNLIKDNRWKMIVNGLGVTMIISFAAQILGTALACFVCFVLMRKNRFVRGLGNLYCGLIHGTPIVVLLMIFYYIIFGNTGVSSIIVAIAAFSIVEAAIIGQNLKGAIDTVDIVEIEAARSIGFSAFRAFMTVTLPQAIRRALPSYTNGFVELVKATAIVGFIALQDLTRAGDIIRSRTYDAYFPLLFVALIYLFVTTICVQVFKLIIRKIGGGAK